MNLAITCIAGVESIVKNEIERLGYNITETRDRIIFVEGTDDAIARINLWSRVGNKVYVEIAKGKVKDFDDLFDLFLSCNIKDYINDGNQIFIDAVSDKSQLNSIPAIQRVATKAIISGITGSKDKLYTPLRNAPKSELLVFIQDNICRLLLNTSGEALHKRGYRDTTHEAPIKESLAAALVILSGWDYKSPLYDLFCGSGTILVEAALLAKNIAPGSLGRRFAFEAFDWYDKKYLINAKTEAESKIFNKGIYKIIGSDISEDNIALSSQSAKNAKVSDIISLSVKDVRDYIGNEKLLGYLVSNPPYGLRLGDMTLPFIYKDIAKILITNPELRGGIITSFEQFDTMIDQRKFKKRKLYNGNEKCYFYKKLN